MEPAHHRLDPTEVWQESPLDHPEIEPPSALWMAVLTQLVKDGRAAWIRKRAFAGEVEEMQAALADLVGCGPMTRWCCAHTDFDPEWISQEFRAWCSRTPRDAKLAPGLPKR